VLFADFTVTAIIRTLLGRICNLKRSIENRLIGKSSPRTSLFRLRRYQALNPVVQSLGLGPVSDRARRLACGSVRDSFESDTRLGPLIGAHRELLRLYELLQFCVGR
jgi:hypothetical protein